MSSVKIENNKCFIRLNKAFYPIAHIQKGIQSFGRPNNISISDKGEIIIESKGDEDLKYIAYELCDHILDHIRGGDA